MNQISQIYYKINNKELSQFITFLFHYIDPIPEIDRKDSQRRM